MKKKKHVQLTYQEWMDAKFMMELFSDLEEKPKKKKKTKKKNYNKNVNS